VEGENADYISELGFPDIMRVKRGTDNTQMWLIYGRLR